MPLSAYPVWVRQRSSWRRQGKEVSASVGLLVTITDSSPDSITEIPQALIGVVGLFGV